MGRQVGFADGMFCRVCCRMSGFQPIQNVIFHESIKRIVPATHKQRAGDHQSARFGTHADAVFDTQLA